MYFGESGKRHCRTKSVSGPNDCAQSEVELEMKVKSEHRNKWKAKCDTMTTTTTTTATSNKRRTEGRGAGEQWIRMMKMMSRANDARPDLNSLIESI